MNKNLIDLEKAKAFLCGHTIALCKGDKILYSDKKGISPMIDFIGNNLDLTGYSVADLIVGKAVAMLFIKAGIKQVFAKTISKSAIEILNKHNIPFSYNIATDKIINRKGDDICPMEKAVIAINDIEQGYIAIKDTLQKLKANQKRIYLK